MGNPCRLSDSLRTTLFLWQFVSSPVLSWKLFTVFACHSEFLLCCIAADDGVEHGIFLFASGGVEVNGVQQLGFQIFYAKPSENKIVELSKVLLFKSQFLHIVGLVMLAYEHGA